MPLTAGFSVVAIIAAYNEADVIGHVVADLIAQDVQVYLLDDGSTDGTVAAVEPYLDRGVIGIERLADPGPGRFEWGRILRRKAELARTLDANWFIHHDADEFRESPWPHVALNAAIKLVDACGFNAIDFECLDFWPVHDGFRAGQDVREAFTFHAPAAPHDRVQIRCWKKTDALVDLASRGGHEVLFPDRKVFPGRFILRHYPIRGQAHGERKVFHERRPRFVEEERARGWHVQYDDVVEGASFIRDPSTLVPYDADQVRIRLALRHRGVEELEQALELARAESDALRCEIDRLGAAVAESARRIDELYDSRSWRWTAAARALYRVIRNR